LLGPRRREKKEKAEFNLGIGVKKILHLYIDLFDMVCLATKKALMMEELVSG